MRKHKRKMLQVYKRRKGIILNIKKLGINLRKCFIHDKHRIVIKLGDSNGIETKGYAPPAKVFINGAHVGNSEYFSNLGNINIEEKGYANETLHN